MQDDLAATDELIASIYDGVYGEQSWQRFLETLAAAMPDSKVALIVNDNEAQRSFAVEASSTWDAGVVERYNADYAALDPLARLLSQREAGQAYADAQLVRLSEFHQTDFFNDFLLPNDMGFAAGMKLCRENNRSVLLGITAPLNSVPSASVVALLNRLAPHLRRAFAHYRKLAADLQTLNSTTDLFDAAEIGMMVLSEGAKVQLMSPTMQAMLANDAPIQTSPAGSVRLCIDEAQNMLNAMLRRQRVAPVVPRMGRFSWRGMQLTLVRLEKDGILLGLEGATVVVLLQANSQTPVSFDASQFAAAYRLTKAESRALSGIVDGKSVDQIAQDAFVSRETIRSQIKSLYAKTGTSSVAEIIRLALLPAHPLEEQEPRGRQIRSVTAPA